jgi:hypothetical protein
MNYTFIDQLGIKHGFKAQEIDHLLCLAKMRNVTVEEFIGIIVAEYLAKIEGEIPALPMVALMLH